MLMKKHVNSRAQPWVADSRVTRTFETKSKCMERRATSVFRKSCFVVSSSWQQPSLPLPWLCTQCQLLSQRGLCFIRISRDGSSAIPSLEDHCPAGPAERGPACPAWACRRGNRGPDADQGTEGSCEPGTHSQMQNPNSYPRGTKRLAREYLGSTLGFPQILWKRKSVSALHPIKDRLRLAAYNSSW